MTGLHWIYPAYLAETSHSKLTSHLLKKEERGWEVCPTSLVKLPQNWVIRIEKGSSSNLAQVTTILGNLYWKHCLLIKKCYWNIKTEVFLGSNLNFTIRLFTWGLANDDNIWKEKHSVHLVNNTINWNNTVSNLWGQSNEKVLN